MIMVRKKSSIASGSAEVRLISETVIECTLEGNITGEIVEGSMAKTKELADQVLAKGKKPQLLLDMHKLVRQDSESRSRSKALVTFGFSKIAVYGASRTLQTIGQYIARIAGMYGYTRFFRTYAGAQHWLEHENVKESPRTPRLVTLSAALIALVGVGVLLGWSTNNETLIALSSDFPAMNPMTAVSFVLLAVAIFLLSHRAVPHARFIVRVIAGLTLLYGVLAGVAHLFGWSVGVDTILFAEKLDLFGRTEGRVSTATALLSLFIGGLLLLSLTKLRHGWPRRAFRLLTYAALVVVAVALIGYAFGAARLYDLDYISLPLNAALGFLIVILAIAGVRRSDRLFPVSGRFMRTYGRGLLVAGALMLVTGLAWQEANLGISRTTDAQAAQAIDKTDAAIQSRVNAYTDALRGYKALFESSSFVSADEFNRYFTHSKLQDHYPGFNTISFLRVVEPGTSAEYEQEIREQFSEFPDLQNFTFPLPADVPQYILTYSEPTSGTIAHGTDVGQSLGQQNLFETARDQGEPRSSEPVMLAAQDGTEKAGFIISVPVYDPGEHPDNVQERREKIYGYVNAVFRDKVIFADIFESLADEPDVAYRITDLATSKVMYQADLAGSAHDFASPRLTRTVEVAGRDWRLDMATTANFGRTQDGISVPQIILSSGVVVAFLAGFLVTTLSRRREEALALASSMTEDLSNEREHAESLRKKDDAILASIGDAVFAIDAKGLITLFNPAAVKLTGYSEKDAMGKRYDDVLSFSTGEGKPATSFIQRALDGHVTGMKTDTKLVRHDGSVIDVADSAAPIRDFEGNLQGVIVVFRDVSNERALDKAKSEFVSLASHQLRTPLSAVNWYSEMLLSGDAGKLSTEQHDYVREIFEGNQRMVELVDSLLNVSRLDVGTIRNDPEDTSMIELADSLQKEMQATITTKNLTLTRDIEKRLPNVWADPKLLRMVVQNLLSNAIKYTPKKGKVTLTMHTATPGEIHTARLHGSDYLFLSITDTGYGIPKEQHQKVFEKLFRADNVRKMEVEGTGLGLYIVREVVKKFGGAIWFESMESVGTTFYVVIPLKTKPS